MPRSTSRFTETTFACTCGTEWATTVHHAVNITLEPELLYALLEGTLNASSCPNCGRKVASALPFVYHDMKRGLFAYVHPQAGLPEEERDALLEQLRRVYTTAVMESERISPPRSSHRTRRPSPSRPRDASELPPGVSEPDVPPMQVIFGTDRLVALVESLLEPEERLGRVALTTRSQDATERRRLLGVAQRMAAEFGCQVDSEEGASQLTVWLYGPRARVGTLVTMLHGAS
ncbi:MAG: hypothetical protein PVSMB4_01450 [Ktedonobacterales bacterium]